MICPHGSSVGELLDPPCHLCRIEELEAQMAALKAATVRPNPADFGAWSQETLAKFAQEVWEENLRLRCQMEECTHCYVEKFVSREQYLAAQQDLNRQYTAFAGVMKLGSYPRSAVAD